MRRPKPSAARRLLPVLAALCLAAWAAAFFLIRAQTNTNETIIPTLMVLPSLTPTDTPAPTCYCFAHTDIYGDCDRRAD